jgi:hypothetical protein
MNLLENLTVAALDDAQDGALARLVVSLGAKLVPVSLTNLRDAIAKVDILIDRMGTALLDDAGFPRASFMSPSRLSAAPDRALDGAVRSWSLQPWAEYCD